MDKNNIYIKWKDYRKEIHLTENFSSRVMERIDEYGKSGKIKISELQFFELNSILNWLLRFALTFGMLALNYQWAY